MCQVLVFHMCEVVVRVLTPFRHSGLTKTLEIPDNCNLSFTMNSVFRNESYLMRPLKQMSCVLESPGRRGKNPFNLTITGGIMI